MNRFTTVILYIMRGFFLLIGLSSAFAIGLFAFTNFVQLRQPAEVMTLNVRQAQPNDSWTKVLADAQRTSGKGIIHEGLAQKNQMDDAVQRVATGQRQRGEFISRSATGMLVYREGNPVTRTILRLTASATQFPKLLATFILAWLVFRILRDIKPGVPFTAANVRRLQAIGILLICSDLYRWGVDWWLDQYLTRVAPAGVTLFPVPPFSTSMVSNWLIGMLLLIIAAGYQRGVELAEDAELTV